MKEKLLLGLQHPVSSLRYLLRWQRLKKEIASPAPVLKPGVLLPTGLFADTYLDKEQVVAEAERILGGELCLYGCRIVKVGKEIDWQRDYLSNYQWSAAQLSLTIGYSYPEGVDIKTPWEISRFHQLVSVGLAYQATSDERYAIYFMQQVSDWINKNNLYHGVNWRNPMEAAIRVINWLVAYDLMRKAAIVDQSSDFYQQLYNSLEQHGRFIFNNLEDLAVKTNHYLADIVGLLWVGTLCPELPAAKKWQRFALTQLEQEVQHQFYPDGVNFEASTSYHRLVVELVGYTVLLLQNQGRAVSKQLEERLKKALTYSISLLKPDGTAPQFGDNDSGRVLIRNNYFGWDSRDQSYLAELAAKIFPDEEFSPIAYFPDGKVGIVRLEKWYVAIDGSPRGQDGNGGHNHDSAGSLELSFGKLNLIVDPGTGWYTAYPTIRNLFRSKEVHNAPQGVGQVKGKEADLFKAGELSRLEELKVQDQQIIATIVNSSQKFQRTIQLTPKEVTIEDRVIAGQAESFTTYLTLAPEITTHLHNNAVKLAENVQLTVGEEVKLELIKAEYSPAYSQVVPTQAVKLTTNQSTLRFTFTHHG